LFGRAIDAVSPTTAPTTATQATPPPDPVESTGGALGRRKRAAKGTATEKPPSLHARIIDEWHKSYLAAHGEEYDYTATCAKKIGGLVKGQAADIDLTEWRAAFDTFHAKPFGAFPEGYTAFGFAIDPNKWRQLAKANRAGIVTSRPSGRPVVDYMGGFKELDEWEQHERSLTQ